MGKYKQMLLDDIYKHPEDTFKWLIPIAKKGRTQDNRKRFKKALEDHYKYPNYNRSGIKAGIAEAELLELYILLTQGTVNLDICEMAEMIDCLGGLKGIDSKVWIT